MFWDLTEPPTHRLTLEASLLLQVLLKNLGHEAVDATLGDCWMRVLLDSISTAVGHTTPINLADPCWSH